MRRAVLRGLAVVCWVLIAGLGPAQAQGTAGQIDENEIRAAVDRANSDEIYGEAYRTGNPELLRTAWAGEALLDMTDDIEGLRALGQYLDLQLEDLDIRRIEPLGPSRVRVVTLERWLARLYQTSGVYVGFQRQTVENRYLLERRNEDWYIIEADQEVRGADPIPLPGSP